MNNTEGLSISATFNQLMSIPSFNIFIVLSIISLFLLSGWLSWYIFKKKSRPTIKKTAAKIAVPQVLAESKKTSPVVNESDAVIKANLVKEANTVIGKANANLVKEGKPIVAESSVALEAKPLLWAALNHTRSGFINKLSSFFGKKNHISAEDLADIEAILFGADIGAHTIGKLLNAVRKQIDTSNHMDKALFFNILTAEIFNIMHSVSEKAVTDIDKPKVILVVGVNGAGKTTSIGKLAHMLKEEGKSVVLGAGDTFRAAAVAQLQIWAERIGAHFICGKEGADPASVLFEAATVAKTMGADYVLCDTAGRLHSKVSLMDELKKTVRVLNKAINGAPHEIYLVIDATMGQNAMAQAREFSQAVSLSGIILSKLDGTAKGGVAIAIVDELKTPIVYVGVGEGNSDFKKFDAQDFTKALFDS